MKKVGRRLVGENPTEQKKLEKMRYYQRKAYAMRKTIEDGNKMLDEFMIRN